MTDLAAKTFLVQLLWWKYWRWYEGYSDLILQWSYFV